MNSLADFVEFLEAEPYHFVGSYWPGDRASAALPLECECQFTYDNVSVLCDGVYRPVAGGQKNPFQVRMRFATPVVHAAPVEITTPQLGEVKGKIVFVESGSSLLVRGHSGAISAHISFSERNVMTVVGVIDIAQRYFGYSLKGTVASNRAVLSNVVGIRGPRSV